MFSARITADSGSKVSKKAERTHDSGGTSSEVERTREEAGARNQAATIVQGGGVFDGIVELGTVDFERREGVEKSEWSRGAFVVRGRCGTVAWFEVRENRPAEDAFGVIVGIYPVSARGFDFSRAVAFRLALIWGIHRRV